MASKDDGEECMPCRGTGRVISNLGGTPNTVTCPWCKGSGVRVTGVDAQASWLGAEDQSPPPDAAA
jgi:DnaJ-class molecular chaperone